MPTIADIVLETRSLCDATSTSYPDATLLRRLNEAYEKIVAWILGADGTWQWDDTNYGDFPIGTYNLVASQNKYSFNDKFLEIEEVQIQDASGDWFIINPIDQKELQTDTPLSEIYKNTGRPLYYDKISDDTINIYPAPDANNVTLSSGLKIKFRRTACIFTSAEVTAGTKVPGFISTAHYALSYMAAIPYCASYKKDRVGLYEQRVGDFPNPTGYKKMILDAYNKRERDKRKGMTTAGILFR